jgi:hypothetical protein
MTDLDKIEASLKGKAWAGDCASALSKGEAMAEKRSHQFRLAMKICAFSLSAVLVAFISSSLTWRYARLSEKTGAGPSDNVLAYVKQLGTHYYPASILNLKDEKGSYADLYYAFVSEKQGYIAVSLHAQSVKIYDLSGTEVFGTNEPLKNFGISGLSFVFSAEIIAKDGASVTFAQQTVDLTPYYNSAVNE